MAAVDPPPLPAPASAFVSLADVEAVLAEHGVGEAVRTGIIEALRLRVPPPAGVPELPPVNYATDCGIYAFVVAGLRVVVPGYPDDAWCVVKVGRTEQSFVERLKKEASDVSHKWRAPWEMQIPTRGTPTGEFADLIGCVAGVEVVGKEKTIRERLADGKTIGKWIVNPQDDTVEQLIAAHQTTDFYKAGERKQITVQTGWGLWLRNEARPPSIGPSEFILVSRANVNALRAARERSQREFVDMLLGERVWLRADDGPPVESVALSFRHTFTDGKEVGALNLYRTPAAATAAAAAVAGKKR